jgi:hypothetical protein
MKPYHFEELHKRGYTLDLVYILQLVSENENINLSETFSSKKIDVIVQTAIRKGLLTDNGALTLTGKELLQFLHSEGEDVKIKKVVTDDDFEEWWKSYPGTDSFVHKGVTFTGTRSLRARKEECKIKLKKILDEGEYTITELIEALKFEVLQKKENSIKQKSNKMTFMQNSLTYLNQRTFEPFIELVREGMQVREEQNVTGGTDI